MIRIEIQNNRVKINSQEEIFIRELTKREKANPTRHISEIPKKEGYEVVFKPYGKDGRGYYYIKEIL